MLAVLGVGVGAALLAFLVREIWYVRTLYLRSGPKGQRSWLLGTIYRSNLATAIACSALIFSTVIRLIYGPQPWGPGLGTAAIILLLAIPVLRGYAWRRRSGGDE